jgi:tight adherence protein C
MIGLAIALLGGISALLVLLGIGRMWGATARRPVNPAIPPAIARFGLARLVSAAERLAMHPQFAATRAQIERRMTFAGNPWPVTPSLYLGLAFLIGTAVAILFGFMLWVVQAPPLAVLVSTLAAQVLGSWIAIEYLGNIVADRRRRISREFPYFLDLSVMSMEAGATFTQAIDIYVRDGLPGSPLVDELRRTHAEVQMGRTFEEALGALEERVPADEVQTILRSLRQGYRMGTPLGQVLREQSANLRFRRTQVAERAAEELKVKLQGPAMLMMVSVLMLILGPAIVEMLGSGVF